MHRRINEWNRYRLHSALCGIALLFVLGTVSAGEVVDAGPPNGNDDTSALQAILDSGNIVSLRPGSLYKTSSMLQMSQGSGIITTGSPATLRMGSAFANMDPSYASLMNPNRVGIRALNGANDLVLSNFKIEKVHIDGSYVAAIWLQGSQRSVIKGVDISGFSLGGIVLLDSVANLSIRNVTIRDSWANTAIPNPAYLRYPQLTGINIDDMRMVVDGVPVDSTGLVIANSRISNLRFGHDLFNRPRSDFSSDPTVTGVIGFETDGINVQNGAKRLVLTGNLISSVGEGIDTFGRQSTIHHNVVDDVFLFSLKFIHGASDNYVHDNVLRGAGYAPIVVAGGHDETKDTFGNYFIRNEIRGIGELTAYCDSAIPTEFRIFSSCKWDDVVSPSQVDPSALAVWANFQNYRPKFNVFVDNSVYVESADINAEHVLQVANAVGETFFFRNILYNTGPKPFIGECVGSSPVPDKICNRIDFPATTHIDVPSAPDRALLADFDGDHRDDLYLHWKVDGHSSLYRKAAADTFVAQQDPIAIAAINGGATHVLANDFNGDGSDDLFFYWSDGSNRLFSAGQGGSFSTSINPILPASVAGFVGRIETGDFNGDGRGDLFFYAPGSGQNVIYFGAANGFSGAATNIASQAINGTPRDVLAGDYNGDGKTDLLFFWPDAGTNRFFYGAAGGYFTAEDGLIAAAAVNGNPNHVWVEDINLDGRDDLNFLWLGSLERRAFLGGADRSFQFD